jgi:hypothetical protein
LSVARQFLLPQNAHPLHQTVRERDEGPDHWLGWEDLMADNKFLTPKKSPNDTVAVSQSAHFEIGEPCGIGPTFVKIGTAFLYPINELDAWDQRTW